MKKIKMVIESYFHALASVESKKSKLFIMFDMAFCMLKYGASPNNYLKFEFYNLNAKQRKTYVTNRISRKMIKHFNDPKSIYIMEDKEVFAKEFSEFYKRDFQIAEKMTFEEFADFCKNKEKFIAKPIGGSQGRNIKVFHIENNIEKIYNEIKSDFSNGYILEEWILQHDDISKIYPKAVNCLRIITVFDGNETHFLTGGLTIGIDAEIANGSLPSLVAPVDFETGILNLPAASFGTELFECHPVTKAKIVGVKLPFWKETIDMLKKASSKVPQIGYIGWDVAITPTGPVIIEGNTTPGYKYYQIPKHLKDGKGNKEKYIKHLK